ncbi:hypothetical protein [Spirosoma foliorum]|uniref:Adenylyltransferase SoFic-like C-terminal domain-containing protein n=1 Tax=Spirosoma foliorum TaxID=2710596 RepID=A0A7G5GNC2_9BACT|nr:hypothetical protein [Spirosoma foliorum]QMW00364.1 hypothetical protein H3H32_20365 [Spirosoma foliorum]
MYIFVHESIQAELPYNKLPLLLPARELVETIPILRQESWAASARKFEAKVYSKELIEVLFEYPYSKIEYLVDRLQVDRRTASKYLRSLEQLGVLRAEKKWKETLFINVALFNLLRQ